MTLLLLLMGTTLPTAGCAMDRDPALVACESDSHCPSGWWCPGTPESPATCTEGTRPADDDDVAPDDDDAVPDDDDTAPDDDDTSPVLTDATTPPGGLCAAPGRSTSSSFAALHCTGPVVAAPGVSSSPSFTVITGSAQLLQLPSSR